MSSASTNEPALRNLETGALPIREHIYFNPHFTQYAQLPFRADPATSAKNSMARPKNASSLPGRDTHPQQGERPNGVPYQKNEVHTGYKGDRPPKNTHHARLGVLMCEPHPKR